MNETNKKTTEMIFKIIKHDYMVLSVLALLVGIAGGFGAIIFRDLILLLQHVFFNGGTPLNNTLGVLVVLVPAIGGLIVGLLVFFFAKEAKGHGVPEVMEAVAVRGGKIRPRVAVVKTIASSVCIGSGGSTGREGPIIQIGAAVGSAIGQLLSLPPGGVKILLACGATAGIAATFNTPIAGVIFAIELILFELKTKSFIPLVISSVTATIISRIFLGQEPAFPIPIYHFISPYELAFYLLLGLLAGIVAVFYIHVMYRTEQFFEKIRIQPYVKPVVGGLCIGAIGLFFPQLFGVGYETMSGVLNETLIGGSIVFLLILCFGKIIANALTLGSGGSGGVFSPSLFIGAMLGGAFGILVHALYPGLTATYGAYALVGMAAVFAGMSRGTLSAIIIVFEMTLNYNIILPLMFACVVSDAVSTFLSKETMYTKKLTMKGITISHDMEVEVLHSILVKDAMVQHVVTVTEDTTVRDIVHLMQHTGHVGFPVLDNKQRLVGVITQKDIRSALLEEQYEVKSNEIMSTQVVVGYPNDTLHTAVDRMMQYGISHLPIVDPSDTSHLVGLLTKADVVTAHHQSSHSRPMHMRLNVHTFFRRNKYKK
ncbi:MAG: chloride channel protein [Candidatus Thermoplasmatota archaeon]|nr:chloride channel protein [Candidatus Thermoplasmatota archaeon]